MTDRPDERDHVRWHDLECGGYAADQELWRALAAERPTGRGGDLRVLDLGCGTGRVALALAETGHPVLGVDVDPLFCTTLRRRAARRRLPVSVVAGDVCELRLGERFDLILAPMQTVQLLPGRAGRRGLWTRIREHLAPGGRAAIAIVEDVDSFDGVDARHVTPDMHDHDGTVYASRPLGVRVGPERIVLDRLREIVGPDGRRTATTDRTVLHPVDAAGLEREARRAGLRTQDRREVAATDEHVASRVVILGA